MGEFSKRCQEPVRDNAGELNQYIHTLTDLKAYSGGRSVWE